MKLTAWFAGLTLALFVGGCGGNGDGNGDGNDNCPDMTGTWEVTAHCEPTVVGSEVVVTQDGCDITSVWDGSSTFTGTLDEDGNATITGNPGGGEITCTGSVSGTVWTSYCASIDCHVVTNKK